MRGELDGHGARLAGRDDKHVETQRERDRRDDVDAALALAFLVLRHGFGVIAEREFLAVDVKDVGDGDGGGIFREADEARVVDGGDAGGAIGAEPVRLRDRRVGG